MAETASEPPLWMLQLENRQKRPHRLAHEIGAGAPCMKCVDSCPGLDLHFWRKLCRNCRCRKEDHEVVDDDSYLQFEILLCSGDKTKNRVKKAVLDLKIPLENVKLDDKVVSSKNAIEKKSVPLDWIPPDVPLDLAAEYMQKLPATKMPITGTPGAVYRKQQFEKQLPRHDLAAGLCHELTDNEIKEFQKYLDQIKSHVVGQGKVERIVGFAPHLIAEVTNQNLQKPYWSSNLKNAVWSAKPYNPSDISTVPNYNPDSSSKLPTLPKFNLKSPRDFIFANNMPDYNMPLKDSNLNVVGNQNENNISNDLNMNSGENSVTFIQPYNATTDKISAETNVSHSSPVHGSRLTNQGLLSAHKNRPQSSIQSSSETASRFHLPSDSISQLPLESLYISDPAKSMFLEHSDPVSLQNPSFSGHLKNKNHSDPLNNFASFNARNPDNVFTEKLIESEDPKPKQHCQQCSQEIHQGEVAVSIDKAEKVTYYHPQCFICSSCQELLVDLVYFFHKNKVYCGRHYAEIVNIPRCFACDELIFVKQYTVAEGENFHIRHFCCLECDIPLAGKEYIPMDNHPICVDCFNKKYGKVCLSCQNIIQPTDKRVSVKDLHWHATDGCFCCFGCRKSLLQSKMVLHQQKPFCNRNCVVAAEEANNY